MATAESMPLPAKPPGQPHVEVIYAGTRGVWRRLLTLKPDSTVSQVIAQSGFFAAHPDYPRHDVRVGIYGRLCSQDHLLQPGDRLEIYRPLVFDPMESRRRRARHRERLR